MGKNWISSPLGIKMLMNFYGKCLKKDASANIDKIIKNNKNFTIDNKVFLLSSIEKSTSMMSVKKLLNVQIATFENHKEFVIAVKNWVQQYGCFNEFTAEKYVNGTGLLTNICMYKGTWKNNKNNLVTIYNSFSYTEDVKYEARILAVPTSDEDFLLVIVVPNESDVFGDLAAELNERGLAAALQRIQPAFSATCKQPLPMFAFESTLELRSSTDESTAKQYGVIRTDESGVEVKVLTCVRVDAEKLRIDYSMPPIIGKCFNFAIVYKDMPLFTGQVFP